MRATLGGVAPADGRIRAAENVHVARTMFGKWSLEILSALYGQRSVGFEDLRRSLHGITASVLSYRLKRMESLGMVAREVQTTRPVRVRYRLTDKGLTVAVLGEPVFLFLQYSESKERRSGRGSSARD
jgi:DNA-binding HxlR family transcriptional regulator